MQHPPVIASHELDDRIPFGWYTVCASSDLGRGAIRKSILAGHELVIFRTAGGQVAVSDAFCPHLGAHFAHGGTIEGETIRCPFHGFCFDTDGTCVKTGYDTKPPAKARLRMWPSHEANGFVYAWYHPHGIAPSFELPHFDADGWSDLLHTRWDIESHPQETTENSVDLGHFSIVHGYQAVQSTGECTIDGPVLEADYSFERPLEFTGAGKAPANIHVRVTVHGLGFSTVDTRIDQQGLQLRLFVLPTPTTPGRIDLRAGMRLRLTGKPKDVHPALSILPRSLAEWFLARASFRNYTSDIRQDFEIWRNKAYIARPPLARGDGPIGRYRRYVRQFYVDATPEAATTAPAS